MWTLRDRILTTCATVLICLVFRHYVSEARRQVDDSLHLHGCLILGAHQKWCEMGGGRWLTGLKWPNCFGWIEMGGEWDVSYRFLISKDLQSQKKQWSYLSSVGCWPFHPQGPCPVILVIASFRWFCLILHSLNERCKMFVPSKVCPAPVNTPGSPKFNFHNQ